MLLEPTTNIHGVTPNATQKFRTGVGGIAPVNLRLERQAKAETLCNHHRRAWRAEQVTLRAKLKIKPAVNNGLMIHTMYQILPTDEHQFIIPPLKKGEFRTGGTHRVARTHADIDRICDEYIRLAKKGRKWGWFHNPIRGRLDQRGEFHTLGSACCPAGGDVVVRPAAERPTYNNASLAEYRERIAGLHEKLSMILNDIAAANSASGYAAANDAWLAAKEKRERAWEDILYRVAHGSRADIQTIARYQRNLLECEFRKFNDDESDSRPYETFMYDYYHMAQHIVWAVAEGKRRRKVLH